MKPNVLLLAGLGLLATGGLAQAGDWAQASYGSIPEGAVAAGHEHPPSRETLYLCRARLENGIHPGKVRPGFEGCNIGWGGRERTVQAYKVLTRSAIPSRRGG